MLRDLNHRGIVVAAERLSAQLGMPHHSPVEGMGMIGKHVGTIDLPMQRLAVINGRQEFTLVPWRPELLKMRRKEIEITVRDRTITMALARGPVRDLRRPAAGVPPYRAGPTASATEPRKTRVSAHTGDMG